MFKQMILASDKCYSFFLFIVVKTVFNYLINKLKRECVINGIKSLLFYVFSNKIIL